MNSENKPTDDPRSAASPDGEAPLSHGQQTPADIAGAASLPRMPFGPALPAGFAQSLLGSFNLNSLVESFRGAAAVFAAQITGELQRSIARNFAPLAELPRSLLPPNLREVSDDITAAQVVDFLEEEGIPLYLIPRSAIGKRLVLSKGHASRRKVLNEKFNEIVDDCATLLNKCTDPVTASEVQFIQDGIGALRAGYHASAQAIFTVTLDTLISRFYPDREQRTNITNRKKGAPIPDQISDMDIRNAYVWLPVWNAHEQFWKDKGDRIPNDYSRHATVHGVSKTQFNKRNCVQSLMLATSLVGYANLIAQTGNS